MKDEGKKLTKENKMEDVGELKEFVGCKIKINKSETLNFEDDEEVFMKMPQCTEHHYLDSAAMRLH